MTGLASRRQRLAVAADGPGAAGKTTLAGQIASRLSLPVVQAGVDGFPLPRQVRYRRGGLSAESKAMSAAATPAGTCPARPSTGPRPPLRTPPT